MIWFKKHSDQIFVFVAVIYYFSRIPNGGYLQTTADILMIIALLFKVVSKLLSKWHS
jgi:hypothetical protein